VGGRGFLRPRPDAATQTEDTARAKGAVSVWRAPIDEFRRLLLSHPGASWEFASILARRQRQMERRLEGFAFKRVEARLAETFRELSGGFSMRCEHGVLGYNREYVCVRRIEDIENLIDS